MGCLDLSAVYQRMCIERSTLSMTINNKSMSKVRVKGVFKQVMMKRLRSCKNELRVMSWYIRVDYHRLSSVMICFMCNETWSCYSAVTVYASMKHSRCT